jgi:Domain of unknown function (DUF4186)
MARERKPLGITCGTTDCQQGLHCFKATKEMAAQNRSGVCRECGANLIDWPRVHQCDLTDVGYTFNALKYEWIRHHFWHKPLNQRAINHAKRKGKRGLREAVRRHLEGAIGPANPFKDGMQTTMKDDAPTIIPFAQHATATCCRKCLEYWHGIPTGQALTPQQLDYCTELVFLFIDERILELTEEGEVIPPIRRHGAFNGN